MSQFGQGFAVPKPQQFQQGPLAANVMKKINKNFVVPESGPTFGQTAAKFLHMQDAEPLLQRQFDETRYAQNATLEGRQKAIDSLIGREGEFSKQLEGQLGSLRSNPMRDFLSRNIQNIVNNPNPLNQGQLDQLNASSRDSNLGLLDSYVQSENDRAAARGLSNSGIRQENIANLTNRASADITKQMLDLGRQNAFAGSDARLQALGIGGQLEDSYNQAINQLLGISSGYNLDIGNSIAQLLATEFNAPDYSGLLNAGIASRESRAGRNKGGFFNSAGGQILGGLFGAGIGGLGGGLGASLGGGNNGT